MFRVIARIDVKNNNVINTVCLEGLRIVGDPAEFSFKYYQAGADELILNDLVASLYQRNNLYDLISEVCTNVFIPITVVGGIRSPHDAEKLFKLGADKVGLNSAVVENPNLINVLAKEFGSQAITASIETRPIKENYVILTDGGRELHDIDAFEWCDELISRGAGEVLITAVNRDGQLSGLDDVLLQKISEITSVPITISGGIGSIADYDKAYLKYMSGVAAAGAFHTNLFEPNDVKTALSKQFGNEYLNI